MEEQDRKKGRGKRRFLAALLILALLFVSPQIYRFARRLLWSGQGMDIPPLYQYDYRTVICTIDGKGKSVASSGCGAVCMAMAVHYFTGNMSVTPETLFQEAYDRGDYIGYGLSHDALSRMAKEHGLSGTWIDRREDAVRGALLSGHPVIAHMGPGAFTNGGHYILLRGLTEDGLVLVNDPNSEENTFEAWELARITRETKGEDPFMVLSRG